jgi:DNA-binding response OmpR family regulator
VINLRWVIGEFMAILVVEDAHSVQSIVEEALSDGGFCYSQAGATPAG